MTRYARAPVFCLLPSLVTDGRKCSVGARGLWARKDSGLERYSRLQPSYTASGDGGGTSPVATLGGSTVADCGTTVPYSVVARSIGRGKIPDGSGTRVKHDRVTKGLQPSCTASGDGGGTSPVATRRKHGTTAIIYPVGARRLWARADPGLKRYWCQA